MTECVGLHVSGGVAAIELCNPAKRNAMTRAMWEALLAGLARAAGDDTVRVLVVRGAAGAFCAGADLGSMTNEDAGAARDFRDLAIRGIKAVADFPVPSVAVIEGGCIGAGCSLALACDLRIAHPSAFFSVPAVRHGIVYDADSIKRLSDLLGPGRAARFLYTAARISAQDALQGGLVDQCSDDIDRALAEFIEAILLADPNVICATRALLRESPTQPGESR